MALCVFPDVVETNVGPAFHGEFEVGSRGRHIGEAARSVQGQIASELFLELGEFARVFTGNPASAIEVH